MSVICRYVRTGVLALSAQFVTIPFKSSIPGALVIKLTKGLTEAPNIAIEPFDRRFPMH